MKSSFTGVPDDEYDPEHFTPAGELRRALDIIRGLPVGSVVALHGQSGHGKTPTAKWLSRETGYTLICLDEFAFGNGKGFDEEAMRNEIAVAVTQGTVIVEGVCACRVCEPDVLIGFGPWFERRGTTKSLLAFIADYDPHAFTGRVATFWVDEPHPIY
jgi:hypothetical protein